MKFFERSKNMKRINKNSVLATTQKHGIKNKHILKILAFLKVYVNRYILFTILLSILGCYISALLGKYIALCIWSS